MPTPTLEHTVILVACLLAASAFFERAGATALKQVLRLGTNCTTGAKAARAYLKKQGIRGKVRIKIDKNSVTDRFDMSSSTLYLTPLSQSSYSLYCYYNALRQSICAKRYVNHRVWTSIWTSLVMLSRALPILTVANLLVVMLGGPGALLTASVVLIIEYAVIVLANTAREASISRELIDISRNSQALEGESLNAAIAYGRAIDFSECSSAWITVREIVCLPLRIAGDYAKTKRKHPSDAEATGRWNDVG